MRQPFVSAAQCNEVLSINVILWHLFRFLLSSDEFESTHFPNYLITTRAAMFLFADGGGSLLPSYGAPEAVPVAFDRQPAAQLCGCSM